MGEITVFTIQDSLRKQTDVSVPWIQLTFGLSYKEAKEFLQQLIKRGWVDKEARGNQYPVAKEKLKLRTIKRKEIDSLIEDIDHNCVSALLCIQKGGAAGASFEDIADKIDEESEARKTVDILTHHDLIFNFDGDYHLCVSPKTVSVFSDVARSKRQAELSKRITGKTTDNRKNIRRLFDVLFDGT